MKTENPSTTKTPPFTADSRLMENYILESPINGGGEIITLRDKNNVLNVFTIGNTGTVYHICPDEASDTGWQQRALGVSAQNISAGILASGLMVIFGVSSDNEGTLFYMQQTDQQTWGTKQTLPGTFPKASIAARNFKEGLYFAYANAAVIGFLVINDLGIPTNKGTISSPTNPTMNSPIELSWSYLNQRPTLIIGSNSMLYSWDVSTNSTTPNMTNSETTLTPSGELETIEIPNQQVLSMKAIEDSNGNAYLFGLLKDGQLCYQLLNQTYWLFYRPVMQDISLTSFVVSTNALNQFEVLGIDQTATLYHTTLSGQSEGQEWTIPWQIMSGIGQIASPRNTLGSSEAFIISSNSASLSYISQGNLSTDWKEQPVEVETANDVTKISSYTMDITLLDENGRPSPNCGFIIVVDNDCTLRINGITVNLNEGYPFSWHANELGKVFLCLETDTLSAPQFQISTAWMAYWEFEPIQPNIQVQDTLKSLTADDLLNAPNLLTGEYHTAEVADNLINGIQESLNLAPPNHTPFDYPEHYPSYQYKPDRNSYFKDSFLPEVGPDSTSWQMDFSEGKPLFKVLSKEDAQSLIAHYKDKYPQYTGRAITIKEVSWGDFWQSIKEGFASIVGVLVKAGKAFFTVVVNGITYLYDKAISFIQQVFDLIQMFFDKVKATFEKVYDFLKFVLNWDDITRSQQVTSHAVLQLFDTAQGILDYAKVQSTNYIDTLLANWNAAFNTLSQKPIGKASFLQTSNAANPPKGYHEGSNNNLILNAYTNHANVGNMSTDILVIQLNDLELAAAGILQTLQNYAKEFSDNPHYQNAQAYFDNLAKSLGDDLDKAIESLLSGLLEMLSGLIEVTLNLAKKIIVAIVSGIQALVNGIKQLISTPMNIPILQEIYKTVTGSEFTMLNVMSLIFAIPTTIVYKIMEGRAPFGDQAAVDQFNAMLTAQNILTASGIGPAAQTDSLVLNGFQNFMTEHKVYFSLNNMFSYWGLGLTKVVTDMSSSTQANQLSIFRWSIASVITEALTIVTSCPWFYSDVPPGFANSDQASNASWLFLFVPMAEDIVAVAVMKKRLALIEVGGPILSVITGSGLIALFAVVANMQAQEQKYSHTLTGANMLSAIPSVFSFLRLFPDVPYGRFTKIALSIIDGGCYAASGILYFVASNTNTLESEGQ